MRLLITALIFLFISSSCIAKDLYSGANYDIYGNLGSVEKRIYNKEYSTEDIMPRIERLESSVFGYKCYGSAIKRIEKLKSYLDAGKNKKENVNQDIILELLENRYFGVDYKADSIDNRLTRLEIAVFGMPYIGSTQYRFDNLSTKVPMNITGITVTESSGRQISFKPSVKKDEVKQSVVKDKSDYLVNIRQLPDLSYFKWKQFPVKIYINKSNNPVEVQSVKNAIDVWNEYIQLSLVDNSNQSQIIIDWKSASPSIEINRVLYPEAGFQIFIHCGNYAENKNFDRILAHQIGHALGTMGHSSDKKDLMYKFKEVSSDIDDEETSKTPVSSAPAKPSQSDINTLLKIYNSSVMSSK